MSMLGPGSAANKHSMRQLDQRSKWNRVKWKAEWSAFVISLAEWTYRLASEAHPKICDRGGLQGLHRPAIGRQFCRTLGG